MQTLTEEGREERNEAFKKALDENKAYLGKMTRELDTDHYYNKTEIALRRVFEEDMVVQEPVTEQCMHRNKQHPLIEELKAALAAEALEPRSVWWTRWA